MYVEAITGKTAEKTARGMEKILDRVEADFNKKPRYILSDDGPEFKGAYIQLLKQRNIEKRRTLGGQPQSYYFKVLKFGNHGSRARAF